MAVVLGTNAGFVTVAPTSDPDGLGIPTVDNNGNGTKDTSSATAGVVTEIGWYVTDATEESNFEVGIYTHDSGNDVPLNLLAGASRTNAKGTDAGWKVASGLNIAISPNTIYWIAIQVDNTATTTRTDRGSSGTGRYSRDSSLTTLPATWVNDGTGSYPYAFYAVWEEAAEEGTNTQINIGDAWKDISAIKINIGDVWKTVEGMQINIGDAWKTVF